MLRKQLPKTKIVVCEPALAPLLESGVEQKRNPDGSPASGHPSFQSHPIQGWTPDFIPKLTGDAVDQHLIDQMVMIEAPEAIKASRDLATKEGVFVGIFV